MFGACSPGPQATLGLVERVGATWGVLWRGTEGDPTPRSRPASRGVGLARTGCRLTGPWSGESPRAWGRCQEGGLSGARRGTWGGRAWHPDCICTGSSAPNARLSLPLRVLPFALTVPTALLGVMGVTWTGPHSQWVPTRCGAAAGRRWGVALRRPEVRGGHHSTGSAGPLAAPTVGGVLPARGPPLG